MQVGQLVLTERSQFSLGWPGMLAQHVKVKA
jgi:hypothetical protein